MHASKRILAASVVTLLWASGMAAAQDSGPYASVFGGANFNHDTDFNIVSSDPSLTGFSSLPGTMYFDAGGVIGGAVGYRWGAFAAEAELSGRRGAFDREELPIGAIPLSGHYDAVSLMANAYYRFENSTVFVPYVGAGAGVAFLSAEVTSAGGPAIDISDTRAAAQAIAGVSFPVGDKAEIGLEYRYFMTDRPLYTINLGGALGTADIGYHSSNVLVRLNWKFN